MNASRAVEQLEAALAMHEAGQLEAAERSYRDVLAHSPDHPDALHLLGLVLDARGEFSEAERLIRRAIDLVPPEHAGAFALNLGNVLRRAGRFDDATSTWRRAAHGAPDLAADAYASIAAIFREQGKPADLVVRSQHAAEAARDLTEALRAAEPATQLAGRWARLSAALDAVDDVEAAMAAAHAAAQLAPRDGLIANTMGRLLMRAARPAEAAKVFRAAATLLPNNAAILTNLGSAISVSGEHDLKEAVAVARRAVELEPRFAGAHELLAGLLRETGHAEESAVAARAALALTPRSPRAYDSLGNALFDLGNIDDAVAAFRRSIELEPHRASHSNLLMALHYRPHFDARELFAEHVRWAALNANPITLESERRHGPPTNARDPDRPLRIGYISPDFRRHPVSLFFSPLLMNHAPGEFEVFLYSNSRLLDDVSLRFRQQAHGWRDIVAMDDDQVAALIREDRIDILVDLAGHTANNRLLVMARRPALVQATYIGYWNTTGMRAIDYRLTDIWNDPPGGPTEQFWVERLARLDGGAWCFTPPTRRADVSESPAARDRVVTFISSNRLTKVSDATLELWRQILSRTRAARMQIFAGGNEHRVRKALAGVDASRYQLLPRLAYDEYIRQYGHADVLLDVGPHNGHTTSTEAMWQGVPVLTIVGEVHCARLGASLLSSVGLTQFIARSPKEYVDVAVGLEDRIEELAEVRRTMRDRLRASPLTDGRRLARSVETFYRNAWREWCGR